MGFSNVNNELNIEQAKVLVDSILNVGFSASVVIDRSSFEVIYQNAQAEELMGGQLNRFCYEVFCTKETPCMDCPMTKLTGTSVVKDRYVDLFERKVKWQYTNIKWFDGRDAVLATLLEIGDESNPVVKSIAHKKEEDFALDKRQTDSLTRIPNYVKFYASAENAIRYNPDRDYAVIVFDINRFKSINDIYGMEKGDEALKCIAAALRATFEYEENYGRLHSDQFAFYMPYRKKGDIIKAIERLRKKIDANSFAFDINISFGIYLAADRTVPVNLMCDRAMMASKTIKDNILKFCAFYDEQYREDMLKTDEIEKNMNRALQNREYKMYLQPKYRLDDNSLCGAEVLCRWQHPDKGLIPPNDFIPLFEKNGFILKLDEYMWEEACKTLRGWLDEGRKPVPLSVNISRYHIRHNDLVMVFKKLLKKYELSSDLLTLEITESLFLDKPKQLSHVLTKLQAMGFRLEVDDFGSGFSSLNLIRNISVDTIKIDKDFLDNEIASDKGKIVVNHTISMAKDLHLQVVAEGVETKEHVEFLKNSQCDIAQGYFFAKPMPIQEFNKLAF